MTVAHSGQISPYLDSLLTLPFVRGASLRVGTGPGQGDALLELVTPRGRRRLLVEETRSHLSRPLVGDLIARSSPRARTPSILFAPYVSPEMGALLASHGLNFVDRAGNCRLNLGGSYVAHIEGRKPRQRGDSPGGLRGPGFRVVFALLAEPRFLNAPARQLAHDSGVSVGTVSNVLRRLEHDRVIVRTKSMWHLVRRGDLVERWIAGYAEGLRPQLLVGRFQTPDADPPSLEARVSGLLDPGEVWAWGGAAAAYRLTQHYRSHETVLHVVTAPVDLSRRLKALPHGAGPLIILGVPGPIAFLGAAPQTVHPLLVYSELLLTGDDRARRAAAEIRDRFLFSR